MGRRPGRTPASAAELDGAAARLRRPPDAALSRRGGSPSAPAGRSGSSARTSTTPARTSSTTRSARRCWRADGQAAGHRRDRRRPARRRVRDRVRAAGARVRRLHGRGGHPPPAAQRPADARCSARASSRSAPGRARSRRRSRRRSATGSRTSRSTHYIIGSAVGPAPYPAIVRELQRTIGDEARAQLLEQAGRLPSRVIACVGGGSNSIGTFTAFIDDGGVELIGVEAAGEGIDTRPPRRAADRGRARGRAARLALGGARRRGRPDPRGALGLGGPRLPGLGARARVPARQRPRALRRGHRRRGARRVRRAGAPGGHHSGARVLARGRLGAREPRRRARPDLPVRARRQGPRRGARAASRCDERAERADRRRVRRRAAGARR